MKKFLIVCTVLFACFPNELLARDLTREQERIVREVSESVMSPFCPGRLLSNCPSSGAHELKEKIRKEVLAGKSEDEILNELILIYGDQIRAAPTSRGFGLTAWLMPFIFVIGGLAFTLLWLKSKQNLPAEKQLESLTPEMQERIERELE